MELGFQPTVLHNFSLFVEAIETAMTISPRTGDDIQNLHKLVKCFLEDFEKLYVGNKQENISRMRLCMFQLIHVARHIEWNGSIRIGSQATVERAIGESGHKIRSKKAPFANLANIIFERELIKLLLLYHPLLEPKSSSNSHGSANLKEIIPIKDVHVLKREKQDGTDFFLQLQAVCSWLNMEFDINLVICRWAKIRLLGGTVLRSQLSECEGDPDKRQCRYFEVLN